MEIKDMCLADIEARKSEITTEMEKDGADLDALTEEVRKLNERKSEIEKREKLRKDIASGIIGEKSPLGRGKPEEHEERVYNAESPEYRTAFFKNLLGKNEEMTKEERAAFVHTTGNTTSPLPTTTLNRIWDLVSTEHHIMEDISIYRTGTSIDVIKHTAITQGKAKKVTENTANDDEQNTFAKVTLSGNDFSKHIDISYAMQRMSIDALEQYLVNEISRSMGEAMATDVITSIESGIATANKVTTAAVGVVTYAELAKLFGLLKRVGTVRLYATRSTIYNHLVGMVDSTGRPIFQTTAQAGQEGILLGAAIKVEDAVEDGKILIGDGTKVTYNMIQDIMIESDRNIKTHTVTYAGYARGSGALIDDKAFAELTVKTST